MTLNELIEAKLKAISEGGANYAAALADVGYLLRILADYDAALEKIEKDSDDFHERDLHSDIAREARQAAMKVMGVV